MADQTIATKPFHLLTPNEKTALRIAQNRAINERIAESGAAITPKKAQRPPAKSSPEFIRATPEERAAIKVGSVTRKIQS
jgi:hypothetical protein